VTTASTPLRNAVLAAVALMAGCASGPPPPAELDTRNAQCAHCGMVVSDRRFAAQIAAPGEEARFFDDIGCLTNWLRVQDAPLAPQTMIYVADYRTKEWAPADTAAYRRVPGLQTPMGSEIVAYASAASRDEDRSTSTGEAVPAGRVLADRWRRGDGR